MYALRQDERGAVCSVTAVPRCYGTLTFRGFQQIRINRALSLGIKVVGALCCHICTHI